MVNLATRRFAIESTTETPAAFILATLSGTLAAVGEGVSEGVSERVIEQPRILKFGTRPYVRNPGPPRVPNIKIAIITQYDRDNRRFDADPSVSDADLHNQPRVSFATAETTYPCWHSP